MSKLTRTKIPRKASGIYQIRSRINGKIYIGSAVDLEGRKYFHFWDLKKGEHCNKHLQRHMDKYGGADLQFSILEFCPKDKLVEKEQYYIDTLQPEFNICKIAYSTLGTYRTEESKKKMRGKNNPMYGNSRFAGENNPMYGKHHSEGTKQKMSKAHKENPTKYWLGKSLSEEHKKKIERIGKENGFFGKKHTIETKELLKQIRLGKKASEETKRKMSKAHSGEKNHNFGKHLSEETKQKLREANIGKYFSEETKQKLSLAKQGKKNPLFGKHHTEETKQKMKDAWKRRKMKQEILNG